MSPAYGALGARYVKDPRAERFLMSSRLDTEAEIPKDVSWGIGPILDQNVYPNPAGHLGTCVGHGWAAWRNAEPIQPPTPLGSDYAIQAYDYAQSVDEWTDTPPEEGTSVQAGAKAMVKDGALKEGYIWAASYDEMIRYLGLYGTIVAGTLWLRDMNRPNANGYITCDGTIDGGHCYHIFGYKNYGGVLECQQSWGQRWGIRGIFYIRREEFLKLMARGHWSLCGASELIPPPPPEPPKMPTKSFTRFIAKGVTERTGITRNGKKWVIAEPWG